MHQDLTPSPQFLNESSAAKYLGVSVKSLQRWRFERRGPAYGKVGGKIVRYSIDDLNKFFDQSRVDHED
jgi:hypothetical protein